MTRRSFDIESMQHSNPIPAVTRLGPLVVSSVIASRDPGSTRVPDTIEGQLANLFHHVGEMLTAAGAGWEHVAKMTFYLPSLDLRAELNEPWVAHFPDPASRPARHTQIGATALRPVRLHRLHRRLTTVRPDERPAPGQRSDLLCQTSAHDRTAVRQAGDHHGWSQRTRGCDRPAVRRPRERRSCSPTWRGRPTPPMG